MVTVITRTIGPSGRDYASFTLAEADVTNIGTSADLVANDEAIVFEADAGTYSESVTFTSTLTTDATRNVTYKPAAGSEHNGDQSSGVIVQFNGNPFIVRDGFTVVDGLNLKSTNSSGYAVQVRANGAVARSCLLTTPWAGAFIYRAGTSTYPCVVENCVMYGDTHGVLALEDRAGLETYGRIVNCTSIGHISRALQLNSTNATGTLNIECHNWLALGSQAQIATGAGTTNLTGSGSNFGSSVNPWPVALQGSPATITASTAYDPGAGDFALYVGKNGALLDSPNNDVIGGGVGPSVNSDVPTTDILGNPRSGATANPGAFEVPQATATLTRTIGPVGRDYASFTLAEADVTNIGGSADLVNENERIVFEADAGTYSESVTFSSILTTDATRQVTYKPASGAEHGGVAGSGVHIEGSIAAATTDDYLHLEGLSLKSTASSGLSQTEGVGLRLADCIVETSASGTACIYSRSLNADASLEMTNGVIISTTGPAMWLRKTASYAYSASIYNCTTRSNRIQVQTDGGVTAVDIANCLSLGTSTYNEVISGGGSITLTGSNNFGGSSNPFPAAIQGSPYPITATTSFSTPLGSGDYAVYMGANGALANVTGNDVWQQGVGPSVNSDVPTTDINGVARSGATCNPGAFEADGFVAPTVLTRTIGSGKDYASFTLAEAAVTSIGSGTDLTFYNEAIVFEADAGTYNEAVNFSSTLTTDATRQVTYKPAAGSEHGGSASSGVRIEPSSGTAGTLRDYFLVFDGLVFRSSATIAVYIGGSEQGIALRNCVVTGSNGLLANYAGTGTLAAPITIESCVFSTAVWCVKTQTAVGSTPAQYFAVRNCTLSRTGTSGGAIELSNTVGTTNVELTNNLVLTGEALTQTGTVSLTGSNNFGGSTNPFPVAIQGSPYPITPTTNTSPGAGDWAIYEAATGRLYHVPDNDVWDQGVGPASNSDVPTTDILGAARSGSTANPGAFETGVPPTVTTNQLVAPNGRLEADTISHIDQYTYVTLEKSGALSGGETVSYHWYFKVDSTLAAGAGETVTFSMKDLGGVVIEEINWAVAYDDATPTKALGSTTTAGPGYTVSALAYAAVSNDWVRCSITLTDHSSRGRDVVVTHTSMMGAASAGTIYGVTIWGSEVTTLDRTPTANELRPVSDGIVDFDAYPAEHRSLFGSYTDLGDNQYRVGITLTDDTSSADYARIEHYQANSAETTHQIYLSSPSVDDIDLDLLQDVLISPPKPGAPFFDIPLITHAVHELGNDGRVPTTVATFGYYAGHLGWWDTEGAVVEKEPQPYGGDKITVIVPPVRGNGSTP